MHCNTEASCVGLCLACQWAYLPFGHIPPCQPYPLKPPSASELSHIPLCEVHNRTLFVGEVGQSVFCPQGAEFILLHHLSVFFHIQLNWS